MEESQRQTQKQVYSRCSHAEGRLQMQAEQSRAEQVQVQPMQTSAGPVTLHSPLSTSASECSLGLGLRVGSRREGFKAATDSDYHYCYYY